MPVEMVRGIPSEKDERNSGDGLDQAQPSKGHRVAGNFVDLKTDDHGKGPARDRKKTDGTEKKTNGRYFERFREMQGLSLRVHPS